MCFRGNLVKSQSEIIRMSRAIAARVENYTYPAMWGEGKNGQPRIMFNYGDGLVAVLIAGRRGEGKREVYRFRYCINGQASTLHIGNGGPENFYKARQFSDRENAKVKLNRAQKSTVEKRALFIGKEKKSKKKEKTDNGFKNLNDLIKFISHLRQHISSDKIALLTALHVTTLLDFWQLLNLKPKDIHRVGSGIYISICIDIKQKEARLNMKLPPASLYFLKILLEYKDSRILNDYFFNDLKKISIEELKKIIRSKIYEAGISYPMNIGSLRNEFIKMFSEYNLFDKNVLAKFFGHKFQIANLLVVENGHRLHPSNYIQSTDFFAQTLLDKCDSNFLSINTNI